MGYKKGIARGHNFEQEIKETFKGGGHANIKDKAMPGKSTVTSDPKSHSHGHVSGKAAHMPHIGSAYTFKPPAATNAHGFGHSGSQKHGPLRLSGSSSAHRIGSRSK
jgi:hypothetical protein